MAVREKVETNNTKIRMIHPDFKFLVKNEEVSRESWQRMSAATALDVLPATRRTVPETYLKKLR